MEYGGLFRLYDMSEPWNGPNNRKLADKMPAAFRCPGAALDEGCPLTNYVVVVGEDTVFPGAKTVSTSDVTDGTEHTVAIVEIENSDIHWMEPRDLRFEELPLTENGTAGPRISGPHDDGPTVGLANGSVDRISPSLPPEKWRALLTRSGAEDVRLQECESR